MSEVDTRAVGPTIRFADLADILEGRRKQRMSPPWVLLGQGLNTEAWPPPSPLFDFYTSGARISETAMGSPGDLYARTRAYCERTPSMAERHLGQMISQRFVSGVLDFGWSRSLERALTESNGLTSARVLVRGEHSDEYVVRALGIGGGAGCIVKILGDVAGHSAISSVRQAWTRELRQDLLRRINADGAIVIGALPSIDYIRDWLQQLRGVTWLLGDTPSVGGENQTLVDPQSSLVETVLNLSLAIAKDDLRALDRENRKRMNAQVRSKQPIDASYSDRLIQRLAHEIRTACEDWEDPTLLVFVHDPAAPGGSEVERRIHRYLSGVDGRGPDTITCTVRGGDIRWVDRHAESMSLSEKVRGKYVRVVVIDSVSFSGHTLKLATDAVRSVLPSAQFYWAALVVSKTLVDSVEMLGMERGKLLSVFVTDRHDIFFPWGWTQATSPVQRKIPVHGGEHVVSIFQRPWGTVESLCSDRRSTIRISTIRPGGRTSYQRHALRDVFFVALDDELGLEFDSEDGTVVEAAVLDRGEYLSVPRGVKYRFCAYRDSVRILEISFGLDDRVNDLERFADDYGRTDRLGDV